MHTCIVAILSPLTILRLIMANHTVTQAPPLGNPVFVTQPTYGVNHEDFQDLDDEYYSDEEEDFVQALEQLEGEYGMSARGWTCVC
jgi:hypothetical protein